MTHADYDPAAIALRGQAIYEQKLRHLLEASNRDKFLVINVDNGEYELGTDLVTTGKQAKSRFGSARLFSMRIGSPGLCKIGRFQP